MKRKIKFLEETHPLTWRLNSDHSPVFLNEYKNKRGYVGLYKAIKKMSSNEIIDLIINSGLKGRGGAGFPTGNKWNLMNKIELNDDSKRYLLCNADEMEPGTYKDRLLMEELPHLLLEGIIIASFALQVYKCYIFIRGEYIKSEKNLSKAIEEAKNNGLIGKNILNSGFNLEVIIHSGAGRYICGEETALINSIEGKRPNPRNKPPFPANIGLWGKPTCINNVETLCNIPGILINGVDWYKNLSIKNSNDFGTKLMGFSGRVNNPGLWELPFGITAREILEDYAEGMCDGFSLKAWQPGGASTSFLMPKHLDVKMDFYNINKCGSRFGTGIAMAIDNTINIVELISNIENFFARESCGLCTPCRDGLP